MPTPLIEIVPSVGVETGPDGVEPGALEPVPGEVKEPVGVPGVGVLLGGGVPDGVAAGAPPVSCCLNGSLLENWVMVVSCRRAVRAKGLR